MGVGSGDRGEGRGPSWIFIHGTDIVERRLIVIFFGLFFVFFGIFFRRPPPSKHKNDICKGCLWRLVLTACDAIPL